MRIVDLLRPYEAELDRIVDETPIGIDVQRHIFMSDEVAYVRSEPGSSDAVPSGTIVLTMIGPDRKVHGDPTSATSAIGRLETGARAMILFGWQPSELPYPRILDALIEHRCQVIQVAAIDLASIGAAAIIERVDDLLPPRDALGEPIIGAPADAAGRLAMELRMANEYVFSEFAGRIMRKLLLDPTGGMDQQRFDAYHLQMDQRLKERDVRIRDLERRIARNESSSSFKLGGTLVRAAKSPRALVRLPADLYRIWRDRGS